MVSPHTRARGVWGELHLGPDGLLNMKDQIFEHLSAQ